MTKVIKICAGEWINASRDKKELSVVKELGANVEVFAKGNATGQVYYEDGFKVTQISTLPLGNKVPRAINRVASIFTWAFYVRKKNADIISGHDLPGLLIGYISNLGKKKKSKLVYDSHEYELGRAVKRNRVTLFCIKKLEKFLIDRSCFSIVVGDKIAEKLIEVHNLQKKPVVARNTPYLWHIDPLEISATRKKIMNIKSWDLNSFMVMYHGMVMPNRGVEKLIELLSVNKEVVVCILGNCPDFSYKSFLIDKALQLNVIERIVFLDAVPIDILYKYVGAADLGVFFGERKYLSHLFALPNKLFENIQSLTPVLTSDFPEMKKIVDDYEIGLTCFSEDINDINEKVEIMRTDTSFYEKCKNNLVAAKNDLCWEKEKEKLIEAYRRELQSFV